jgi:hypothetical protein
LCDVLGALGKKEPVEIWGFLDQLPEIISDLIQVSRWGSERKISRRLAFPALEYICHAGAENTAPLAVPLCGFVPAQWLFPVRLTRDPPL